MNLNTSEEDKPLNSARDALSALPSLDEANADQDATSILLRSDLVKSSRPDESNPYLYADDIDEDEPDEDDSTEAAKQSDADATPEAPGAAPAHHIVVPEVDAPTDASPALSSSAQSEAQDNPPAPVTSFVPQAQTPIGGPSFTFDDTDGRRSGRIKIVVAVTCAVVAVLIGVYVYFGNYYTTHFFPHTTVNGDDVSGMSVDELSQFISNIGSAYKVHVTGAGLDFTVNSEDISFVYDGKTYGEDAGSQINAWSWPLEISRPHAYTVQKGISYDENKLNDIVGATVDKFNETATQPTNAGIRFDGDSSSFVAIPEAVGTAVRKDDILPLVNTGVSTMQDEVVLGDDLLVQPAITQDSKKIRSTIKRMNKLLDNPIKLTMQGNEVFTVDKSLTTPWIGVNDQLDITIDHDAIVKWAQGPLSAQIDTKGTKRTYTRPDGKQVTVEGGSSDYDYGWCLDGAALAETLTNSLNNADFDAIELPMSATGATWNPGGQDWPARYIDVDLSEQYVRMYDESSNIIWETECVSGNPIYGGGTDTGVFFIYRKASPETLKGLDYNNDGKPDYETPVTFWMPFDGGEGLHDASWRGSFGGNIYSYDGSHGCVNLPYAKAEQLYGITNVGDTVVVHW